MTEINNLEITVEQLMHKIQEEVERNHNILPSQSVAAKFPNISGASVGIFCGNISSSYIETLLKDADFYSQTPTEFPKKLNRFPFNISKPLQRIFLKLYEFIFKKQRVVNSSLSQALRATLAQNRQLIDQVNALQEQLREMEQRLAATDEQVSTVSSHLVTDLGERLTRAEGGVRAITERLTITEVQSSERLTKHEVEAGVLRDRLSATDELYLRNDTYIKNDLAQQKRLITLFLEEARQRFPEPFSREQLKTLVNEDQHLLDAFFVALEDQFRGSRDDILNRLKIYLPLIEEATVNISESLILDVGCGRGEWLELLKKSGYAARGIDINKVMLEQCRGRGLEVIEADVIAYLQSLPDDSLLVLTGFHIIEHLPFEVLIKLFDETMRVLKPGGLCIFETPNPQNVLIGSCYFYLDPTHRNPLPSPTIKFMAESRGFSNVKILDINPCPDTKKIQGDNSQLETQFNQYFYGPQDYAVVGFKS